MTTKTKTPEPQLPSEPPSAAAHQAAQQEIIDNLKAAADAEPVLP